MPTLIDLRRRIKSVKNTQQITKAMKTVSTAKFKKAQRTVLEGRPLWHDAPAVVTQLSRWVGGGAHPLFAVREEKRIHVIVITSDKGLCGAFNSNLMTKALEFIRERAERSDVRLVLVGKKAVNFFKKHPYPMEMAYADKVDKLGTAEFVAIAGRLMQALTFQDTDAVYVVYNEFKSILGPRITAGRLLPIASDGAASGSDLAAPDWEPETSALLRTLIPRYVEDQLCHCYFESLAAEQAARMMAMDNASKNAEELIEDLVLVLNKIRQAGITKELLEIISAVEALKK